MSNDWIPGYEFWRMAPGEVWWVIEAKMPPAAKNRPQEMAEIVRMVKAERKKEEAA